MRQSIGVLILSLVAAASLFAAQAPKPETLNGYLIDVRCATQHAKEMPGYAESHNKECLLMDKCVRSGYAVVTAENKLVKFDSKGNREALNLIKATDKNRDWRVTVTGKVDGDRIAVDTIALQK